MPPRRQRRPSESPALIAFGRQMRRMREAKGVKQETIAHITQVSGPQVSKIETGKKRATRSFVEIVDDRLEANGALINLWEDLNKDGQDRKSTRLNSSHVKISYAVFCLQKKRH